MTMSPKMPRVAAFGLLHDLNEFLAHSLEERQSVFDAWVDALDRRTPMLEALEADRDLAAVELKAAERAGHEAAETARLMIDDANANAKEIVAAATSQAESINQTVADNLASAKAETETAAKEHLARVARDGADLKEREDAVQSREGAVAEREEVAVAKIRQGEAVKTEYEALVEGFNALQRRAPR